MPTTSSSRAMRRWIRPPSRRCPHPARSTSKGRGQTCACRCARLRKTRRPLRSARKRIRRWPSTIVRPHTDPAATIDIRKGLAPLRAAWIAERNDTIALPGPTSTFGQARLADPALAGPALRPAPPAAPRESGCKRFSNALRAPRDHHAGDGIRRDPRESAARIAGRAIAGERAPPASGTELPAPRFPRW